MSPLLPPIPALEVVSVAGRARGQYAHPLDGRYGALDPRELRRVMEWLAAQVDLSDVDCVIGIPEGGIVPAYAFAAATAKRVVFGTVWQPDVADVVGFDEPHEPPSVRTKFLCGLASGERVILVEDEITSGVTVIACVRALRAAGIGCDTVVAVYAADDPAMRERFAAEGTRLCAAATFAPSIGERLYAAHPADAP